LAKVVRRPGESLDHMLRRFGRKVKRDGIIRVVRSREAYTPPSEAKREKRLAAGRRRSFRRS